MAAPPDIARENGKKGGRPVAQSTLAAQKMREQLILRVKRDFNKLVGPQFKKAIEGDYTAYKDLMDRAGITAPKETPVFALQINMGGEQATYYEN